MYFDNNIIKTFVFYFKFNHPLPPSTFKKKIEKKTLTYFLKVSLCEVIFLCNHFYYRFSYLQCQRKLCKLLCFCCRYPFQKNTSLTNYKHSSIRSDYADHEKSSLFEYKQYIPVEAREWLTKYQSNSKARLLKC